MALPAATRMASCPAPEIWKKILFCRLSWISLSSIRRDRSISRYMSRSSALLSWDLEGLDWVRDWGVVLVAIGLKNSLVGLRLQKVAQPGEGGDGYPHVPVVAQIQVVSRVGPPSGFHHPASHFVSQPPLHGGIDRRGDMQAFPDPLEKRRHQRIAPIGETRLERREPRTGHGQGGRGTVGHGGHPPRVLCHDPPGGGLPWALIHEIGKHASAAANDPAVVRVVDLIGLGGGAELARV